MRQRYQIMTNKESGCPEVHVDNHEIWDLVEYLSNQRQAVAYSYGDGFFIVQFTHLDRDSAQAVIDEWSMGVEAEYQSSTPLSRR